MTTTRIERCDPPVEEALRFNATTETGATLSFAAFRVASGGHVTWRVYASVARPTGHEPLIRGFATMYSRHGSQTVYWERSPSGLLVAGDLPNHVERFIRQFAAGRLA
jgi:anti-sigma factor RsiW